MDVNQLNSGVIVSGPLFPEAVQIITANPVGNSMKLVGKGMQTLQVYELILSREQVDKLSAGPEKEAFDGDGQKFRLGIEAIRLGLAYEYDPYFSLSIARVDPLPHQLEAVYDYFIQLPRIRFLLADDPGAGKTIMAGLLIKELKIRGLIQRILVVTPANLTFQWQRELRDKFRERFEVIRGSVLRENYGSNPWQERDQVITSVSWISRVEDAKESLLRSHWDLVIVDEAHKMSAYSADKKTLAYQLGEALSARTDHFLLMTATPHKGDPENFRLFLELLDKDVYGDIRSLEQAMEKHSAPFYLRRIKEALVTFPDPNTQEVKQLYTRRNVRTTKFQLNDEEFEFYDDLTQYVEDQSIKASQDDSYRGRALGFTMAMLQRRFASSMCAVRRSLERMKARREKILADPEAYRQQQIEKRLPGDFDDLPEDEQQKILSELEEIVITVDPIALREEIITLDKLIDKAQLLEVKEVESKLVKLKEVITQEGIFHDENMKLLIFTEHKDTLDYLVEKLRDWGLKVTQIHGGMKIGDRNTPNTRIYAEWEFKESCQVMVATEAAGEGINLQFCWFMINYDIPWNPVRLEQRMGRIHRYGQENDCLIINFVSTNTREGRVLNKLLDRIRLIESDLDPKKTGSIFNVLGDIFPSNRLEQMLREMYARNLSEEVIKDRIVKEVDIERFKHITHSTLEGLAKKELNLTVIVGKSEEAKEKRLVPEVVEDFFVQAASMNGISPKETGKGSTVYRIGKIPRHLWPLGEKLEPRFGLLGKEYARIVFDQKVLKKEQTLEWVTPGHPLFEVVRESTLNITEAEFRKGAVFYDINRNQAVRLDVFTAAIRDGRNHILHRRVFVVESDMGGMMFVRQPTIFLDLIPAQQISNLPDDGSLPGKAEVEQFLIQNALDKLLENVTQTRLKEIKVIKEHLEISLQALIHREQLHFAELHNKKMGGDSSQGLVQSIKNSEERLEILNLRLEERQRELEQELNLTISDIQHFGRAWVLPHPERETKEMASMVRDEEVERIAIEAVMDYEKQRGWEVESVENEDRGFDLISRKPHLEDARTAIEVRFIEVKGRGEIGEVLLSSNEYKTAIRLKTDYWLYVVYHCATKPEIHVIKNPAELGWKPIVKIEHYQIGANVVLDASR